MFNFPRKKIGIIGFGNMGSAIGERIRFKYAVYVFDKIKTIDLENITVVHNLRELVGQSEVVILAVKPQDFDLLLKEIKNFIQDKLIISIAAGITTGYIQKVLGKVKVVRAMPNIAVKIAEGETSICKGKHAKEKDLLLAKKLFKILGKVWELKEDKIDSVTAISGSGPAYILYDMEIKKLDPLKISIKSKKEWINRLNEAALKVGIEVKIALELAASTTVSTIHLVKQTGNSPAQLRKMITSSGGTTEAALKVIINGGSWPEAALAAKQCAQELLKKE
ncbi:MAG: pyrroline-5-carboxylate reductase [Candidatus Omnitrophota bacterium]